MVYFPYLLPQYIFGLSNTKPWETKGQSSSARYADVAAKVGEEAGPVLRCFEVELLHIKYKLLNLLGGQYVVEKGRGLCLVLVGHAVAE